MKTTLILKDELVREAKSRAALQGCSMSKYVEACLEKSFSAPPEPSVKDFIYDLPAVPIEAVREVNEVLKEIHTKNMVSMQEAKNDFSRLVSQALAGEDVVITRDDQPLLRLSVIDHPGPKRKIGILPGLIKRMGDDFNDSFEDWSEELEPQ